MTATETVLIVTVLTMTTMTDHLVATAVRMTTMMTELYGNEAGTDSDVYVERKIDGFQIRKGVLELVFIAHVFCSCFLSVAASLLSIVVQSLILRILWKS